VTSISYHSCKYNSYQASGTQDFEIAEDGLTEGNLDKELGSFDRFAISEKVQKRLRGIFTFRIDFIIIILPTYNYRFCIGAT